MFMNLTHDSGVNFDLDADVIVALAQQQHLLAQHPLLLGHVFARHLEASWWGGGQNKQEASPLTRQMFWILCFTRGSD